MGRRAILGVLATLACAAAAEPALGANATVAVGNDRTLSSAGRANLTLKIAKRDLGRLRRALAGRRRAVATVTVTSRAGGTTRTGKRRITLVR